MNIPLFCENCRTLHPADAGSHFELFGLEPTYELDEADLHRRYLQCSRHIHPDRFAETGGETASLSLRVAARLNEAYRVLGDPVLRAGYLLELYGGQSSAADKSVPPEVLNQTLALREEIAAAKVENDEAALDDCARRSRERYQAALADIADLARRLPGDDALLRRLRQALNAVKYYQRLLEQL